MLVDAGRSSIAREPGSGGPSPARLEVAAQIEHLDSLAREPMIAEHPDGTLFVTGYGGRIESEQTVPLLWKSSDHGSTWSAVNVGTEADGAHGNSDVDLAVGRDGTLYLVSMGYDRKANEGTHIAVGVSGDVGKTWHWTTLSRTRFDDRPWIAVTPDGAAHVIWNDGAGVSHAVSRDHGATWSAAERIHSEGGSSHLAAGPNGELAVRVTPVSASGNKYTPNSEFVAVSTDGGVTWQKHKPPGERNWVPEDTEGAIPRWVEPVAWDANGHLWLLWTEASGVWLARSTDRGESWKTWQVQATSGDTLSYFPYLVARGRGELAATWFSGAGDQLRWQVCEIQVDDHDAGLHVALSAPLTADTWKRSANTRDTGGEYVPVQFLNDGDLAVVTPIQNKAGNRWGFAFWRFRGTR
jgi:hypothetical protein